MQIQERLRNYPVPDEVWEQYHLDQEINDRGIMIDRRMVEQALRIDELSRADLTAKMQKKTGLENPNSVLQMKEYLNENGMEVDSLGKKDVAAMMKTAPDNLRRCWRSGCSWPRAVSENMRRCATPSALMTAATACSSSMARTAAGAGPADLSNYKTCPRTIWRIWSRRGNW